VVAVARSMPVGELVRLADEAVVAAAAPGDEAVAFLQEG